MTGQRYALILFFVCALGGEALGQPALAPQAGILVLRNGMVIGGDIVRAGDYYVVSGEGSELRPKADDVECFCASLDEAYEFKMRRLAPEAKAHLRLAEWCLRNDLHRQCADQLIAAMRLEPNNAQIKQLENRLALAAEAPASPPDAPMFTAAGIGVESLEKALRELPAESVERFGEIVQPILLNRCGANQCHGPNSKAEFRLLRPPAGQAVSLRFTQRNLFAALKYLDRSNPEASPLVIMPQQRHGPALAPVFDKHSEHQLTELLTWARLATRPSPANPPAAGQPAPPAVPRTIAPPTATLSQPAAAGSVAKGPVPSSADTPAANNPADAVGVQVMRPPLDHAARGDKHAADRDTLRDPYDPEIFNRRFQPAK